MVGTGWVVMDDGTARISVDLPCPGEDVGFDPQPEPPVRLDLTRARSSFELDAVTTASCTNNLHEGSGTGTCGGEAGFVINWSLTDNGRSGIQTS